MHIGGPFAAHDEIAKMATARIGQAVPIVQPIRRLCTALMEDGTGVQFERMAYEHPAAQAVHEAIYDQAFVQGGLGRGRGINRSVTTPLEIFVYGNVPLPVPVPLASLSRWQPNRERMLLAEGGTHLTCSTSAATPFQTKRQRRSGASAICSTRTASAS
jgi:hypothetical protein